MVEFTNKQESMQKAKVLSYERQGEGTKLDKIVLTYIRTDTEKPSTTMTTSKFTNLFTDEEQTLLKSAKETKGEVVLVKVFDQKPGAEKGYWNLKTIQAVDTYVKIATKASNGRAPQTAEAKSVYQSKGGYNEAGVKAGAVLHDAVAVAIAIHGKAVSVSSVATVARELLALSTQLENEVRDGFYNSKTPSVNTRDATSTSKPTVLDTLTKFDSLDDLDTFNIDL